MANMPESTTDNVINNVQELSQLLSNVCLSVADAEPGLVTVESKENNQKQAYKLNSIPVTSFLRRNLCVQPRDVSNEQPIYSKGEELIYYGNFKLYHVRYMDYRFAAPVISMNMIYTPIEHLVRFEAWTNKVDEWVSTKSLLPMYRKNKRTSKESTKLGTNPQYEKEYNRKMTISMMKLRRMGKKYNKHAINRFLDRRLVVNEPHTKTKIDSEMDQSSSSEDM